LEQDVCGQFDGGDANNIDYALMTSMGSGCNFGVQKEDISNNQFVFICALFSSLEFDCDFE
jgi:hypothetical protein